MPGSTGIPLIRTVIRMSFITASSRSAGTATASRESCTTAVRPSAGAAPISEQQEVQDALTKNIDLLSGYRSVEKLPAIFDVDGISPRPFKIVRLGPVYLFVENPAAAESFYRDALGFTLSEEIVFKGHRCLFLRCNTEHHSLALLPLALRDVLGLGSHSKCRVRLASR